MPIFKLNLYRLLCRYRVVFISILVLTLCANFLITIKSFLVILDTNDAFRRDFLQDYLLSLAFVEGVFPYQPVETLSALLLPVAKGYSGLMTSPHPPTIFPFILWMPALSYLHASLVWLCLQIAAVFFIAELTRRILSPGARYSLWLYFILFLGSTMFQRNVFQGQLGVFVALFFFYGSYFLDKKQEISAGLHLGLAVALKLFSPFGMIYLFLSRRFKLVSVSALLCLLSLLPFIAFYGASSLFEYLVKILALNSEYFLRNPYNQSLFALVYRIFGDCGPLPLSELGVFWDCAADESVRKLGVFFALLAVLFSMLIFRSKGKQLERFLFFSLLSLVLSPLVWFHSYILLWPIFILSYQRFFIEGRGWKSLYIVTFLWFLVGDSNLKRALESLPLVEHIPYAITASITTLLAFAFLIMFASKGAAEASFKQKT